MRGKYNLIKSFLAFVVIVSILAVSFVIDTTKVEASSIPISRAYGEITGSINPVDLRNPKHKTTINFETYGKPVLLFYGDPVNCYNSKYTLKEICSLYEKGYFGDEVTVCIYEIKDKTNEELLQSVSAVPDSFYVMQLDDYGYGSKEMAIYSKLFNYCSNIENSITMPLLAYIDKNGELVHYSSSLQTGDSIVKGLVEAGAKITPMDLPLAVIEGTKQYDKAYELLDLINKERIKNGHNPLTINRSFTNDSMQRAAELIFNANKNTRPDYMPIQTLNPDFKYESNALFFEDAADVFERWVNDTEDNMAMMSDAYKSAGIGVVEIDGIYLWTCDYSTQNDINSSPKENEKCEFKVGFMEGERVDSTYYSTSLKLGEKFTIPFYTYVYSQNKYNYISIKRLENVTYSASKSGLVSFDNNVVTALKSEGTTTIKVTAPNNLDINIQVELKSGNSNLNPTISPSNPSENNNYTAKWIDEETNKEVTSYENVSMIMLKVSPSLSCAGYESYKDGELIWRSSLYENIDYGTISTFEFYNDLMGDYYLDSGMYKIVFFNNKNEAVVSSSIKVSKTKPDPINQNKPTNAPEVTSTPTKTPTSAPTSTAKPTAKPTAAVTSKPTVAPVDKNEVAASVEDFAERLYTTCLGRPAEEDGKAYWTSELKNGKTGAEVAEGFFFSPEYEGRKLNNKDFISTLYETFMGRTPANDEVAYWNSEMNNGKTRKDIFDGFVNSTEWANICLTYGIRSGGLATPTFEKEASPSVKAFAERLYTTCLGRDAEKAGLEWWAAELANLRQTGTVAAQGFFFSPEFLGLKTNDEEYVTRLYKTFMGREPESAGFKYWVGELKSGKDRQYVFDGFSVAPEFANLCAEAGIMR